MKNKQKIYFPIFILCFHIFVRSLCLKKFCCVNLTVPATLFKPPDFDQWKKCKEFHVLHATLALLSKKIPSHIKNSTNFVSKKSAQRSRLCEPVGCLVLLAWALIMCPTTWNWATGLTVVVAPCADHRLNRLVLLRRRLFFGIPLSITHIHTGIFFSHHKRTHGESSE